MNLELIMTTIVTTVLLFCLSRDVVFDCIDPLSRIQSDIYLDDVLLLVTSASSILHCATECGVHSDCLSFGFEPQTRTCHLHTGDSSGGSLTPRIRLIHSDIMDLPNDLLGPCAGHGCETGEKCHVNRVSKSPVCVTAASMLSRCPMIPSLPNAHVTPGSRDKGSERTYTCNHGYLDTSRDINEITTTCLGNGTWSDTNFKCSGPFVRQETDCDDSSTFISIHEDVKTGSSPLRFLARSCAGFTMRLTTTGDNVGNNTKLFVSYGTSSNQVIRIKPPGTSSHDQVSTSPDTVLDCNEFRSFWFDWTDGTLSAGTGEQINGPIKTSWVFPGTFRLLSIDFSGRDAATWLFYA